MGASFATRAMVLPVTAGATFLTVYLVVQTIGAEGYALVALVSTLSLLVPFADLGLGAVVVNTIAASSLEDVAHRDRVISATARWLALSGAIVVGVGVAGATLFSWSDVIGGAVADSREFDIATMLALVLFGFCLPLSIGQRMLVGLNLNHIYVAVTALASLVALAITYGAVVAGVTQPLIWFSVALPAGTLAAALTCTLIAVRRSRFELRALARKTHVRASTIFETAGPMFVVMIGLPIALQSHRIILAWRGTADELADYSMAMQLYAPLWSVIASGAASLWPQFAKARQAGANETRLWNQALITLSAAGAAMASAIVLAGPFVSDLISGGLIGLGFVIVAAAGALLFVQAIQQGPGMYLTDASGLRFQAGCVVVLAIVVPVASWFVVPSLGATGPIVVMAAAIFVIQLVPGLLRVRAVSRRRAQAMRSTSSIPKL